MIGSYELNDASDVPGLTSMGEDAAAQQPHIVSFVPATPHNRTIQQNKALHLWLTQMAAKMTELNLTNRKLWDKMNQSFDIPISQSSLKEITQQVSLDQFGEKHTSNLSAKQLSELYEILNRAFGQSVGVSLPFPDRFGPKWGG